MAKNVKLLQGNEACVHGAIYAGMRFFAGYPITPSTEIAEVSSVELPKVGGKFIQMEDEIAGMAATIGGAIAGKKALTATSGPGFSLKQENIGYAAIAEIPCVIANVQRCGPSTGLPTSPSQGDVMQAKWGTHGDHPVIAISPTSVKECFELTVKAFNFAEKYRTPVIFLLDEGIGHLREKIVIPKEGELEVIDRKRPNCDPSEYEPYGYTTDLVPAMADFGTGYKYNITGLFHDEVGFPINSTDVAKKQLGRLMAKIENNLDDILIYDEFMLEDAEFAFVSYGSMARTSKEVVVTLREKGVKVGLFTLKTIWPFPQKQIEDLAAKMNKLYVVEMNLGQVLDEVKKVSQGKCELEGINKANGEMITPDEILAKFGGGINA